jgi:hypothetical protein
VSLNLLLLQRELRVRLDFTPRPESPRAQEPAAASGVSA